jgi:hypothetical protein
MIMDKPSVDLLEKWLFKKLKLLRLKAERVEFYNEILKLKKPHILDVYYFYSIKLFFVDIQYLIDYEDDNPPKTAKSLSFEDFYKDRDNATYHQLRTMERRGHTNGGKFWYREETLCLLITSLTPKSYQAPISLVKKQK